MYIGSLSEKIMNKILVIKHGALGDIVLATGPFQAIRKHHPNDHITLLTTSPYAELLKKSGYFDEVWVDSRPKLYRLFSFLALISKIRKGHFSRIYDMQTSERTSWYFWFLGKNAPEWVGTAPGASHRHNTPERTSLHSVERQKQQLQIAGINELPKPNVDWLTSDISRFVLPERYALIAAGGSSHRPGKRWPACRYAALCNWLVERGITPVLIGTNAEATVLSTIETLCSKVKNLFGQTGFADIATLARGAVCAIGNDTGPIHIIATAGCPTLVLFSQFSNPTLCAPRGANVTILSEEKLSDLLPGKVIKELEKLL
jgi:ADP-heptose:LPS heptosyltransferase